MVILILLLLKVHCLPYCSHTMPLVILLIQQLKTSISCTRKWSKKTEKALAETRRIQEKYIDATTCIDVQCDWPSAWLFNLHYGTYFMGLYLVLDFIPRHSASLHLCLTSQDSIACWFTLYRLDFHDLLFMTNDMYECNFVKSDCMTYKRYIA